MVNGFLNNKFTADGALSAKAFDGAYNVAVPGGWVSNLGVTYAANTLSIASADGSALSATNPGYVIMPSIASPGLLKKYTVTANQGFIDDTGASEIINNLFGLSAGIAHADQVPFFIYAVTNDAEDSIAFMICRTPSLAASPAAANIGAPDDAVADLQGDFFSFESLDEALYDLNPCLMIGGVRMTMSAANDWTVVALVSQLDGIGKFYETTGFVVSAGQFSAAAGKYWIDNAGTAPGFTTNTVKYKLYPFTKEIGLNYTFATCNVAGVGAVTSRIAIPLIASATANPSYKVNLVYVDNSAGDTRILGSVYSTSTYMQIYQSGAAAAMLNDAIDASDSIYIDARYHIG